MQSYSLGLFVTCVTAIPAGVGTPLTCNTRRPGGFRAMEAPFSRVTVFLEINLRNYTVSLTTS